MRDSDSGWHVRARPLVLALSAIGLLLFGASWLVLALQPERAEAAALDFMKGKILEEARDELQQRTPESVKRSVLAIQQRLGIEARHLEGLRESALADQVGEVVAGLCSCGTPPELSAERQAKQRAVATGLRAAWEAQADKIRSAAAGLTDFITERYQARRERLLTELRLFTGSNALFFLATFAMAAFSGAWARPLLVPTGLLMLTTVASSYVYLFEQDWFHSILFESYVGTAYLAYVAVVFAMLVDVVLNKARVTSAILQSLPSALVPPC